MDAPPFCPAAGFYEPVASITRRQDRAFRTALGVVLGIALGFLTCVALVLTCSAPRCGFLSQIAER